MSLRYQKYCLRLAATALVITAALVAWTEIRRDDFPTEESTRSASVSEESTLENDASRIEEIKVEAVQFTMLQRPLFDPPPPPVKKEVIAPPPPLNVRLLGTVIDPLNPQAIIQDRQGNISFRSLGQPVSAEHPGSTIEEILPAEIKVRRVDRVDTVSIE